MVLGIWWGAEERGSRGANKQLFNPQSAIRNSQSPGGSLLRRVEAYKGVEVLLAAWESIQGICQTPGW